MGSAILSSALSGHVCWGNARGREYPLITGCRGQHLPPISPGPTSQESSSSPSSVLRVDSKTEEQHQLPTSEQILYNLPPTDFLPTTVPHKGHCNQLAHARGPPLGCQHIKPGFFYGQQAFFCSSECPSLPIWTSRMKAGGWFLRRRGGSVLLPCWVVWCM